MNKFYNASGNPLEGCVKWFLESRNDLLKVVTAVIDTVDFEFFDEKGAYFCEFGGAFVGVTTRGVLGDEMEQEFISRIIRESEFPSQDVYCVLNVWCGENHEKMANEYGQALLDLLKPRFHQALGCQLGLDYDQTRLEAGKLREDLEEPGCSVLYVRFVLDG